MRSETPRLRPAAQGDARAVADVFIAARAGMTYLPRIHSEDEDHAFFARVVRETEVVVADTGGRVVGFAALGPSRLDHLYVHPEQQRAGIGTALLDRAKELRPDGFDLWVFQPNDGARRFYEAHGLRLVRTTEGENEERVPDALYAWKP